MIVTHYSRHIQQLFAQKCGLNRSTCHHRDNLRPNFLLVEFVLNLHRRHLRQLCLCLPQSFLVWYRYILDFVTTFYSFINPDEFFWIFHLLWWAACVFIRNCCPLQQKICLRDDGKPQGVKGFWFVVIFTFSNCLPRTVLPEVVWFSHWLSTCRGWR